jgi:hypothetical protein
MAVERARAKAGQRCDLACLVIFFQGMHVWPAIKSEKGHSSRCIAERGDRIVFVFRDSLSRLQGGDQVSDTAFRLPGCGCIPFVTS